MAEEAARAYELESDESPWRTLSCFVDGVARHLAGDLDGARERLEEGASRVALANVPQMRALCFAQLSVLAWSRADDADNGLRALHAKSQAEHFGLTEYPTMALVFAASADHYAQTGQVEQAASDRKHALALLGRLGDDYLAWYHVEACAVLARVALRLSDLRGARTLVSEARRFLERTPDAVALRDLLDELAAQTQAILRTSAGGQSQLTTAELRVVQMLPTHLSFREIAEELHLSPNTVKTQAHAAYSKLDVSSRSEAVEQARALGLVEEHENA